MFVFGWKVRSRRFRENYNKSGVALAADGGLDERAPRHTFPLICRCGAQRKEISSPRKLNTTMNIIASMKRGEKSRKFVKTVTFVILYKGQCEKRLYWKNEENSRSAKRSRVGCERMKFTSLSRYRFVVHRTGDESKLQRFIAR